MNNEVSQIQFYISTVYIQKYINPSDSNSLLTSVIVAIHLDWTNQFEVSCQTVLEYRGHCGWDPRSSTGPPCVHSDRGRQDSSTSVVPRATPPVNRQNDAISTCQKSCSNISGGLMTSMEPTSPRSMEIGNWLPGNKWSLLFISGVLCVTEIWGAEPWCWKPLVSWEEGARKKISRGMLTSHWISNFEVPDTLLLPLTPAAQQKVVVA